VTYDFEDLMELSIVLLLRVYWTIPDVVIDGLRKFRCDLRRIYREAYFELTVRKYPSAKIIAPNGSRVTINGLYLDLNIRYLAGQMIEFGPPRAISPFEAASRYASTLTPARSYLPLNASVVAAMIASRALDIPPVPRGAAAHSTRRGTSGRWKSGSST
jgi:hypothetical protein